MWKFVLQFFWYESKPYRSTGLCQGPLQFFLLFFLFRLILDAYTTADVDYRWKGGDKQSVEIVSKEMAQFDLTDVKTYTKSQTNSKGEF